MADFDSALYEQVEPPLVSLYLPTHGSAPGDESDRIEFEALVEQARAKLAQERERREYKGVDERLAYAAEHFDDLMSPAPGGSLAVLAGNDQPTSTGLATRRARSRSWASGSTSSRC